MNKTKIILRDLVKIYQLPNTKAGVPALRSLGLEINLGEIITIIGPSGSGKTTLINLISGRIQSTGGEINVFGREIHDMDKQELLIYRKSVGYIGQFPNDNVLINLSVKDNLMFSLSCSSIDKDIDEIMDILSILGIDDKINQKVSNLSGGEIQRVALACALIIDPVILICDEPTGSLDSETTNEIILLISKISQDRRITTLIVTHDKSYSLISDKTYKIVDGSIDTVKLEDAVDSRATEEFLYLNKDGTLKIPNDIIKHLNFCKYIKFKIDDDKLILYPKDMDE